MIALSSLPEDVQVRALQMRNAECGMRNGEESEPPAGGEYEKASPKDKAEADRKLGILHAWRAFLAANGNHGSSGRQRVRLMLDFLRIAKAQGMKVSKSSLYAWEPAYRARGTDGLLPRYGTGRTSCVTPRDRALFLQCWGTEQQPTLATAYRAFLIIREREGTPGKPPTRNAFRYLVDNLSQEEEIMLRCGPKAVRAALLPYIERDWEGCLPLEWWVMDHSPLDILTLDDEGRVCRPYLTALMDMGTRRACVTVCRQPNQNTVLWTLAKAILAWGSPQNLYLDNGKEFIARSVTGGRKIRFTLGLNEDHCRSLCDKFHIIPHFAIKENAQAKPIERWFRTLESQVAVLFESFVGRDPAHKPEGLKEAVKAGRIPRFRDVERIVAGWIEGVYHEQAHTGNGMGGNSPNQVWAERIGNVRVTRWTVEDLRYLLMKTERPVIVSRYQVRLFGRSYESAPGTDCLYGHHGQKVLPHFNPDDITRIFLTLEDEMAVGWVVEKRRGRG
jgi:hypothetical protein